MTTGRSCASGREGEGRLSSKGRTYLDDEGKCENGNEMKRLVATVHRSSLRNPDANEDAQGGEVLYVCTSSWWSETRQRGSGAIDERTVRVRAWSDGCLSKKGMTILDFVGMQEI